MRVVDTIERELLELLEACDSMPQIAQQVQAETLGHAVLGARRSIYETPQGGYERSHDLERSITARAQGSKDRVQVTVSAGVPYAAAIEFGTRGKRVSAGAIVAIAKADPYRPVYLGRTGLDPTRAGPFITPAAVFSVYRTAHLLKVLLHK